MTKAISEPPRCEVCGGQTYRSNTTGVCRSTPECRRENKARRRKVREASGRQSGQRAPGVRPRKAPAIPPGTVFGRLTTLEESPQGTLAKVLCRCECGTEHRVQVQNLRRGITRSCGCLKRENAGRPKGPGGIYLPAGFTSGRLTTLEDAIKSHVDVRVRCECGTETAKFAQSVKFGRTTSCGCFARETSTTHGLSGHPLYSIWHGIISRASNPNDPAYKRYGARGRTVCEHYRGLPDGLLNYAADMGPRPGPGYSTERLDNSGGYWCGKCPECTRNGWPAIAWRTADEQQKNRDSVEAVTARFTAELEELRREFAAERGTLF